MILGVGAMATAAVPPVSATLASGAAIAGGIEVAADATRVAITGGDPKAIGKLVINVGTGTVGKITSQAMKNIVAGDALEKVEQAFIEGTAQTVSGITSTMIKNKVDEEKE